MVGDEIVCPDCFKPCFSGRELGGHAKTHKRTRDDAPMCFLDPKDWDATIQRLRTEHPSMKNISRDFALAESCAVCPLEFMQEMQSQGRCFPSDKAIPQRDLGIIEDDE